MDLTAVELAESRLNKAHRAIKALKAATNFDEAEDAWTDFLLAASAIYTKLEQGSKSDGKSQAWFGRKKKERKDDQLLRYLHFARNSDEHGISRVVSRYTDTGPIWGQQPKFGERIPVILHNIDPVTKGPIGEPVDAFYSGSTIKLIRVKDDRFGDFCDPPKMHMGKLIKYPEEPLDISELAIPHFENLINEARNLASPPEASR